MQAMPSGLSPSAGFPSPARDRRRQAPDGQALENPFYRLGPDWFHYGLVAFATLATIVASQAIISGAFSLTHQAIQLTHHLKHIYALHERVLLVAVRTMETPRVPENERAKVQELPAGLTRVVLHYGFMESPSVPEGLRLACEQGQLSCRDLSQIAYYLGRETTVPTERIADIGVWRKSLYAFMRRNAERSAAYFCIPAAQVVALGIEIEI